MNTILRIDSRVRIVILVMAIVLAGCGGGAMKVTNLRCEYMDNPLGIDNPKPQLSWVLPSDQNGQSAYRIVVASDQATLGRDVGGGGDDGTLRAS